MAPPLGAKRLLCLLGLAAMSVAAAAAPTGPAPAPAEARWFTVGALKVAALHDAQYLAPNDGSILGADVGAAAVAKALADAGAPTDSIALSVNVLLVKSGGHLVLLDTGLGPAAGGGLLKSLALASVSPDQITDILITHSHFDHIGGLIGTDGKAAFPKAVVRMAAAEWDWMKSQPGAARVVAGVSAQVQTFEPGAVVAPGITSLAVRGHTPGHVAYQITSKGKAMLDIGDTAHSSILSLAHPEWTMNFDTDRPLAKVSRRATLTRLAKSHETVFSPHFPFPGVGQIEAQAPGFVWRPAKAP